jgi:hypothetical protein
MVLNTTRQIATDFLLGVGYLLTSGRMRREEDTSLGAIAVILHVTLRTTSADGRVVIGI